MDTTWLFWHRLGLALDREWWLLARKGGQDGLTAAEFHRFRRIERLKSWRQRIMDRHEDRLSAADLDRRRGWYNG